MGSQRVRHGWVASTFTFHFYGFEGSDGGSFLLGTVCPTGSITVIQLSPSKSQTLSNRGSENDYLNPPISKSGFPGGSDNKASACNPGDLGSIPRFRHPTWDLRRKTSSLQALIHMDTWAIRSGHLPTIIFVWLTSARCHTSRHRWIS